MGGGQRGGRVWRRFHRGFLEGKPGGERAEKKVPEGGGLSKGKKLVSDRKECAASKRNLENSLLRQGRVLVGPKKNRRSLQD